VASEHDLQVFSHGLKDDQEFRHFVLDQEKKWGELDGKERPEAARLRIAVKRFLEGKGMTPPRGAPLLPTDEWPAMAVPSYEWEDIHVEEIRLRRSEGHQEELYYRRRVTGGKWERSVSPRDAAAEVADRWRAGSRGGAAGQGGARGRGVAGRGPAGRGQSGRGQAAGREEVGRGQSAWTGRSWRGRF
jgi:hypothetical protein